MKLLLVALLLAAATTARAQAPALDAFLEQRATEELAADGQVLSRLGVSLDIELIGERAVVTLLDLTTGRAVASSKIDALPADRDAAVATVTQVVASLVAQIGGAKEPKPASPAVEAVLQVEERAKQQQLAERQYLEQKIGFGIDTSVSVSGTMAAVTQSAYPWRGELQVRLTSKEFYELVERPDLYAAHRRRRATKIGSIVGGSAMIAIGMIVSFQALQSSCDVFGDDYDECHDRTMTRAGWGLGIAIAGFIPLGYGFFLSSQPISETEAKGLAAEYNRKLRGRLELPNAARAVRSPIRDVAWSPYVAPGGGGMFVAGRF